MKREKIMGLWQACFHDPEPFVRFYFERKYRDEEALLYEEGGEALSAFLMLSYPLVWGASTFPTSYISGACTAEKARNRGLMRRLLAQGFRRMYGEGIVLSTLIPAEEWLYGYYAASGYAPVFRRTLSQWHPHRPAAAGCRIEVAAGEWQRLAEESYPYFSRCQQERPCRIHHTPEDYATILGDLYLSGGSLLLARQEQAPHALCGMALAFPEESRLHVKELSGETPEIRDGLLAAADAHFRKEETVYRALYDPQRAAPYGMARIIRAEPLLQHFAATHPQMEKEFSITDPLLPENQGTFRLAQGRCHRKSGGVQHSPIGIADLAQALFAAPEEAPYLSLMID